MQKHAQSVPVGKPCRNALTAAKRGRYPEHARVWVDLRRPRLARNEVPATGPPQSTMNTTAHYAALPMLDVAGTGAE